MVLLFVVCGWREEAVAGVFLRTTWYILHTFFGYQGYESRKNCKPSCTRAQAQLAELWGGWPIEQESGDHGKRKMLKLLPPG